MTSHTYLYIEVRDYAAPGDPTMISFRHAVVKAANEEEAYTLGQSVMDADPDPEPRKFPFLNDYVVRVP